MSMQWDEPTEEALEIAMGVARESKQSLQRQNRELLMDWLALPVIAVAALLAGIGASYLAGWVR